MEDIIVEKVTMNIGAGEAGDKLEKAVKLLEKISGAKPVKTKTMKRIPTWGLRPNLTIGVKVTSRGKKAEDLLKRLLQAKDNKLKLRSFDKEGNFSFGIEEYLLIPGVVPIASEDRTEHFLLPVDRESAQRIVTPVRRATTRAPQLFDHYLHSKSKPTSSDKKPARDKWFQKKM